MLELELRVERKVKVESYPCKPVDVCVREEMEIPHSISCAVYVAGETVRGMR